MQTFTENILNFLLYHAKSWRYDLTMVPSKGTAINLGDILLFKYHGDRRKGHKGTRMCLVVTPVTKEPKTGNELLSAVRIPTESRFTPEQISDLYNLREKLLPLDNYRTYSIAKMEHIRRIEKSSEGGS